MLSHVAFVVPLAAASSLTSAPTPKPTVDIFPLTTAISTPTFDIPDSTYLPEHHGKRDVPAQVPTLTFDVPHTTRLPRETTRSFAWPYPPSSINKREGSSQTGSSSTPIWTTLATERAAVSTQDAEGERKSGVDDKAIIELPTPWQPSATPIAHPTLTSSSHSLKVPRIFLPFLAMRSVFALTNPPMPLPRHETLVTATTIPHQDPHSHVANASAPVSLPTSSLTPTSWDFSPTLSSPPPGFPSAPFRECPDHQQNCGAEVCYDPMVSWCCPGKRNVCKIGDVCAEANSTMQGGEGGEGRGTVYGCGPFDVSDGLDSRISTVPLSMMSVPATTVMSATMGHAASSAPTGSAGSRLGVPGLFKGIVAIVHDVRAVTLPAPFRPDCCGDMCCAQGQVCTRSSEGAKCWPVASRRGIASTEEERAEQEGMVHIDELQDKKGGGGGHGGGGHSGGGARPGAGAPAADGGHISGTSRRSAVPMMLYVFLLTGFVVANLPTSFTRPIVGGPQIDPSAKEYLQT